MKTLSRRHFLRRALAAGAWVSAANSIPVRANVLGANDTIRLGLAGVGLRGLDLLEIFRPLSRVRVTALCDADRGRLEAAARQCRERNEPVTTVADYRRMLEAKDLDAVVIATPDHWHALMAVWACQAGKDVYVEKPISHNIREGRQIVQAARKYDRIVQAGTQNRSDTGLREAFAWLHQGHLGRVRRVRCTIFRRRESIGRVSGPQPVPAGVDYNLFLGPASLAPLRRKNLHYDWHWVWPTGTGEVGNLGAHELDVVRWALGRDTLARQVIALGGRFGYEDDGETPNTVVAFLDYSPVPVILELRGLPRRQGDTEMDGQYHIRSGLAVECEHGAFVGGRGGGWVYDREGRQVRHFPGDSGATHAANWIDAIRTRRRSDLRAEILEGHLSATLCHMVNLSCRIGHRRAPEALREQVRSNSLLAEAVERFLTHLEANGVDLAKTPARAGPLLTIDPDREEFTGPEGAIGNLFLSRNYREPFVMPEPV